MKITISVVCMCFLLLPMSDNAMAESLAIELVMLTQITVLQYEDIDAIANVCSHWRRAVEKTGGQRKAFITEHLFDRIPYLLHNQKTLNEHDLVFNKHGTACSFVCIEKYYPYLTLPLSFFRVQLTKNSGQCLGSCYDLPITIFKHGISDKDMRPGKQCLEQGSGFTKRYVFATCMNNIPLDNMHTTCFAPFFNNKDEACVHVFRRIVQQTPITEYSLDHKGESKERACFIDEKLGLLPNSKPR